MQVSAPLPEAAADRVRRPRRGTAERREEILRAAMRTFGSKGYHNASLAEVAEQVGITHAGVLHHFGSKDRLLWAVLEYRDLVDVEHLEGQHIPGGLDLFRHLVKTARMNSERRGIVQTYTVLTAEAVTDGHPASDWVRERFITLRGDISDALRTVVRERDTGEGGSAPETDPQDPEFGDAALTRAASAIIGVMDGLQTQWLLDPEAVDLADASAFAIEAILAATLAGSTRSHPTGSPLTPPSGA
ncbi:TetR/AcrR family transcriptional regulator [Luteimicrobium subarcticum]|uniref:TetR family transcriptional regulator n=1 Tax=Luteimicrobium subarcticum TaxID=620910 RepID=A0A2M8WSH6_9MICO|nr:TetR/AcrR family transcriptional regulator [Luteimicrobium subarcticum]PJI93895.1 TetR family transcriptional regulator [Luteimicrobium subarcticum]